MNSKVDFVIMWVDGSDPEWRRQFAAYKHLAESDKELSPIRYEEHGLLKYLFRGIEKFTPWVSQVHFVTCGQHPGWMKLDAPKLHLVNHNEIIRGEYLPVFNSHAIEINLHRIKDLSEQFVYFNDDIFIIRPTAEEFFFKNGLPCDSAILRKLPKRLYDAYFNAIANDVKLINVCFDKTKSIYSHPAKWFNLKYGVRFLFPPLAFIPGREFPGFKNHHSAQPYLKSTFREVWEKFCDELVSTESSRFRSNKNLSQFLFRYWQLASGSFTPTYLRRGRPYYEIDKDLTKILSTLTEQNANVVCINDAAVDDVNYEQVIAAFDRILPLKSSYEL